MPISMTPTQDDISTNNHVSSKTVPKKKEREKINKTFNRILS